MRATEFIRGLLDLIDSVDQKENQVTDYEDEASPDLAQDKQYSNSPDEHITPTDTMLSIGNDVNKPKHPADIRVSTVALYPDTAYKGK
jgi:hypothetical protein